MSIGAGVLGDLVAGGFSLSVMSWMATGVAAIVSAGAAAVYRV